MNPCCYSRRNLRRFVVSRPSRHHGRDSTTRRDFSVQLKLNKTASQSKEILKDMWTKKCFSASDYLKNVNQDQSYGSVKIEKFSRIASRMSVETLFWHGPRKKYNNMLPGIQPGLSKERPLSIYNDVFSLNANLYDTTFT